MDRAQLCARRVRAGTKYHSGTRRPFLVCRSLARRRIDFSSFLGIVRYAAYVERPPCSCRFFDCCEICRGGQLGKSFGVLRHAASGRSFKRAAVECDPWALSLYLPCRFHADERDRRAYGKARGIAIEERNHRLLFWHRGISGLARTKAKE